MKNILPLSDEVIIGSFEYVSLPLLHIENVVAKIDTGAYSGAVHCMEIKVIKRKSDDKKVLSFKPFGAHTYRMQAETYAVKNVRSSNGHLVKRYLIDTDILIRGIRYSTQIGISDRSDMQREVLIGRRFLKQHNMLVDVRINQELDNEAGEKI